MSCSSIEYSRSRLAAIGLVLIGMCAGLLWHAPAAAARNFPMALWWSSEEYYTDLDWFWLTEPQPHNKDRKAILRLDGYYADENVDLVQVLTNSGYDWSRIAAVWIDEPYLNAMGGATFPPCDTQASTDIMIEMSEQVATAAALVHDLSPTTRVWVNFSAAEVNWAPTSACPFLINAPYIDVVSIDYYGQFHEVKQLYDWLKANPAYPHQQRALVPLAGSKISSNPISPTTAAAWLLGYFEYAQEENETCDQPLGPGGPTGLGDGCSIWIVTGWPGIDYSVDGYVGFYDPSSEPIRDAWRAQRQIIRRDQAGWFLSMIEAALD